MFKITKTEFEGLVKITNPFFYDRKRGYFSEIFNKHILEKKLKHKVNFIQDNQSYSKQGVLRGLHYQSHYPQTKLISVAYGEIQDIALDLRKDSKTYGKYYSVNLSSKNQTQLLIPKGFAHGFLVLSKFAIVHYKVDYKYLPNFQRTIYFNDNNFNIKWSSKIKRIILSKKDDPKFKNKI